MFVYPVLTHWGWSSHGWMAKGISAGASSTTYIVRRFKTNKNNLDKSDKIMIVYINIFNC